MTTESIDELKRALTRHGDELQLYANGVAEDEIGSFELSESRIVILIYRLYEEYGRAGLQIDYKTQKFLNGLKKQLAAIRSILYDGIENDLEDELPELVEEENKFWKWFFGFGGLNAAMLERISKYGVYNGFTRKQIIEKVRQNDLERLYGTIAGGINAKMDLADLMRDLRKKFNVSRRDVKTEIEAIINGTVNDTAIEFARNHGLKLIYTAVMDNHVCSVCAEFNGEVYQIDDPDIPTLPRHINCRCMLIPADDREIQPASFLEYLTAMSESEQRERLGNAKYELWQSGEYTLRRYEDPLPGQRLSLNEITMPG